MPKVTNITNGKVITFPNGVKILTVELSWTGDTGTSSFGSATCAYSLYQYTFPSAFQVSTILSAQATSIDKGGGLPSCAIEVLTNTSILVDDFGYSSSVVSSRPHSVSLLVVGI